MAPMKKLDNASNHYNSGYVKDWVVIIVLSYGFSDWPI